jgi:hypothetical protein
VQLTYNVKIIDRILTLKVSFEKMLTKRNTIYQNKMCSASLFALAILVLVVSCPLKRLFINNSVSQTSIPSKSNQTSSTQYSKHLFGSYSNCYSAKNKVSLFQDDKSQHKQVDPPVYSTNSSNHTGYYIQSFLNTTRLSYNVVSHFYHSPVPPSFSIAAS